MFLIRDGQDLAFLHRNPSYEGFAGEFEADINLYYPDEVHDWPDGADSPGVYVGVSKENPKCYRVFGSAKACERAGYKKVTEDYPAVHVHWSDYVLKKIQRELMPEHAQEHLAVNLETGEYVLGRTSSEVFQAFLDRWPNKPMFKRRVDGSPSIRFRGK
jgi:hypothetical protein